MAKFTVWDPEDGDETDGETLKRGDFITPDMVATEFAEERCSDDCDYYSFYEGGGRDVCVRDEAGELHKFTVSMVPEPTFYAAKKA